MVISEINREFGVSFDLFGMEQVRDVEGEEAFKAKLHYNGMSGKGVINLDFTFYEKVELPPKPRLIFHPYSDHFKVTIPVYQLEEIVAEKLRAILNVRTYHRGRDVYDLWYLSKHGDLNRETLKNIFEKKCDSKKKERKELNLISLGYLEKFRANYQIQLENQLKDLPDYSQLAQQLSDFLRSV